MFHILLLAKHALVFQLFCKMLIFLISVDYKCNFYTQSSFIHSWIYFSFWMYGIFPEFLRFVKFYTALSPIVLNLTGFPYNAQKSPKIPTFTHIHISKFVFFLHFLGSTANFDLKNAVRPKKITKMRWFQIIPAILLITLIEKVSINIH